MLAKHIYLFWGTWNIIFSNLKWLVFYPVILTMPLVYFMTPNQEVMLSSSLSHWFHGNLDLLYSDLIHSTTFQHISLYKPLYPNAFCHHLMLTFAVILETLMPYLFVVVLWILRHVKVLFTLYSHYTLCFLLSLKSSCFIII